MDDRELEARLSTYLHQRFDAAPLPSGLAAAVREGMLTTPTTKVGFASRPRGLQIGWAATLTVAVVVGAILLSGRVLGPATPGATPTPTAALPTAAPSQRAFVVLPTAGSTPSKAASTQAGEVFEARLRALGLTNFTTALGSGFELYAPADGPSDDDIRAVLSATGEVEFVPLPPEILGDVDVQTLVGKPVPNDTTPLFGHDGIASVTRGTSEQDFPTVDISLTPAASALFADYTTNHAQEYLAIVIDGKVALAPVINAPITGGEVSITGPDTPFDVAAAILIGGRLPGSWQDADVPVLISADAAIVVAKSHGGGSAGTDDADLDVFYDGSTRRAVWRVSFSGGAVVTVDAISGEWLSTLIP